MDHVGTAVPFTEVFRALGLQQPDSTAIDVDTVRTTVGSPHGAPVLTALSRAVCGVLAAVVAFADPELVVVGGTWGREALHAHFLADDVVGAHLAKLRHCLGSSSRGRQARSARRRLPERTPVQSQRRD